MASTPKTPLKPKDPRLTPFPYANDIVKEITQLSAWYVAAHLMKVRPARMDETLAKREAHAEYLVAVKTPKNVIDVYVKITELAKKLFHLRSTGALVCAGDVDGPPPPPPPPPPPLDEKRVRELILSELRAERVRIINALRELGHEYAAAAIENAAPLTISA